MRTVDRLRNERARSPAAKAASTNCGRRGPCPAWRRTGPRPHLAAVEGDAGDLEGCARRAAGRRGDFVGGPDGSSRALPRDQSVVKRKHPVADDLAGLVALAGKQDDIALPRYADCFGDRFAASGDLGCGGAPAMIAERIAAGSSLRGLSSVTITMSECASLLRPFLAFCPGRGRRRRRKP